MLKLFQGRLHKQEHPPENEGYQKYYYAFFDTSGKRHTNTIEDFFSDIEGNYIVVPEKVSIH